MKICGLFLIWFFLIPHLLRKATPNDYIFQGPRFKNFYSSRNSLKPTLRPNLQPNSDDSLCHMIDSCKIFGLT